MIVNIFILPVSVGVWKPWFIIAAMEKLVIFDAVVIEAERWVAGVGWLAGGCWGKVVEIMNRRISDLNWLNYSSKCWVEHCDSNVVAFCSVLVRRSMSPRLIVWGATKSRWPQFGAGLTAQNVDGLVSKNEQQQQLFSPHHNRSFHTNTLWPISKVE